MSARNPITLPAASAPPRLPRMTPTTPVRRSRVTTSSQRKPAACRRPSRGAMDVVEQLRVGVEIPPPGFDLVMQVSNAVDDRHRLLARRSAALIPGLRLKIGRAAPV